jgi:hypothetical protein
MVKLPDEGSGLRAQGSGLPAEARSAKVGGAR